MYLHPIHYLYLLYTEFKTTEFKKKFSRITATLWIIFLNENKKGFSRTLMLMRGCVYLQKTKSFRNEILNEETYQKHYGLNRYIYPCVDVC